MADRFSASNTSVIGCSSCSHAAKIKGLPLLAYLMGSTPQTSHFRRFSIAAHKSLLFLQHEIQVLELQLEQAEKKASSSSDPDVVQSNFDFQYMKIGSSLIPEHSRSNGTSTGVTEKTQCEIRKELTEKLKEYEEGMLRYRQLASHDADKSQIRQIQLWLAAPKYCDQTLSGVDSDIWGSIENPDSYAPDLIPLCVPISGNRGHFAHWFSGKFIRWIHRKVLYRFKKPDADSLFSYNGRHLNAASSSVDFLVCILLIFFAMYVQGSKSGQDFGMMVFTAVTSVCIAFFGNHKLFMVVLVLATLFNDVLNNRRKSSTLT